MQIDDIILKGQEVSDLSELSGGLALEDELQSNLNFAIVCSCEDDPGSDNLNFGIYCKCGGGRPVMGQG
jgi:hypothetical protein